MYNTGYWMSWTRYLIRMRIIGICRTLNSNKIAIDTVNRCLGFIFPHHIFPGIHIHCTRKDLIASLYKWSYVILRKFLEINIHGLIENYWLPNFNGISRMVIINWPHKTTSNNYQLFWPVNKSFAKHNLRHKHINS